MHQMREAGLRVETVFCLMRECHARGTALSGLELLMCASVGTARKWSCSLHAICASVCRFTAALSATVDQMSASALAYHLTSHCFLPVLQVTHLGSPFPASNTYWTPFFVLL